MNSAIKKDKFWTYLIWYSIIVLILIFHFVSLKNKMPWDNWLMNNMPIGLAVLNSSIICVGFLYFAIPRERRSLNLSFLITSVMLVLSIPLKISMEKAPMINISVLIFTLAIFLLMKNYFKKKQNVKL